MTQMTEWPRSRSILGPLLLIALGTLWLLSQYGVIAIENVWGLLRFWPLLLIIVGVDLIIRTRWPLLANLIALVTVSLAVAAVIFASRLGLIAPSSWYSWMPFTFGGPRASGHIVTEARPVSDFDAVTFSSLGDLTIQPGTQASLTIEAEDDVLRAIRTEVRGDHLYISYVEPGHPSFVLPTRPIRFTLTVVDLEAVDLAGAGNVVINDLATDRLDANLSGTGSLKLNDLQAESLYGRLNGTGGFEAWGSAGFLDVVVSGIGSFDGADLRAENADVTVSGTGSASVWATGHLNATVTGVGSVTYFGHPEVDQTVTGLGTVRHGGDK